MLESMGWKINNWDANYFDYWEEKDGSKSYEYLCGLFEKNGYQIQFYQKWTNEGVVKNMVERGKLLSYDYDSSLSKSN